MVVHRKNCEFEFTGVGECSHGAEEDRRERRLHYYPLVSFDCCGVFKYESRREQRIFRKQFWLDVRVSIQSNF
jgi:hypothetical protein